MSVIEFKPLIEDDKEYARRKTKPLAIIGLISFFAFIIVYYSNYSEILELANIRETAFLGQIIIVLAPIFPLGLFVVYIGKIKVKFMLERSG